MSHGHVSNINHLWEDNLAYCSTSDVEDSSDPGRMYSKGKLHLASCLYIHDMLMEGQSCLSILAGPDTVQYILYDTYWRQVASCTS